MYGISTRVGAGFIETIHRVISAFQTEGFGIQGGSEVVSAQLRSRLAINDDPYPKLGACSLQFSYQAIGPVRKFSLLSPCNVVVRETEDGSTRILFMNSLPTSDLANDPRALSMASVVRVKLGRVIESLRE
ncbi:MAG TPA: DUF302 domain-containing protein [Chromatiaceae bacterium]|jgi:uncharacterized protein (DUF302 family)|nr:MAG: hypothetical protein N838_31585 [Thiohalocapsa sp. PB-PSB1]QQO54122.1 MAG: DUF302 domain-containing protein [Thiohalocapsa sp. PB-PSB1]HBG94485.1 DUF302 domain-containing protein [Chromatiaceae bacterium]HCS92903.1 DUF302 domain-containing protein [Chromatiaceae bacterium]